MPKINFKNLSKMGFYWYRDLDFILLLDLSLALDLLLDPSYQNLLKWLFLIDNFLIDNGSIWNPALKFVNLWKIESLYGITRNKLISFFYFLKHFGKFELSPNRPCWNRYFKYLNCIQLLKIFKIFKCEKLLALSELKDFSLNFVALTF